MDTEKLQHGGGLYSPETDEFKSEQARRMELLYDFNNSRPSEQDKRDRLLREMFAEFGEGSYVEPPLRANWSGKYVHFGRHVYVNFGLTLVDDTHIYVGDNTMIAPNVTITATGHPVAPELRKDIIYQFSETVYIGRNCWIGAGAVILPGVSIGDNSVIGAGSVVTKDIPADTVAVGNPCRVLREINERDRKYYFRDREIDPSIFSDNV